MSVGQSGLSYHAVTQFTPNIPEYPSALQLVEIMENGKHAVMAPYLSYHVDQSSNSITTMYDLHKNGLRKHKQTMYRRNPYDIASRIKKG